MTDHITKLSAALGAALDYHDAWPDLYHEIIARILAEHGWVHWPSITLRKGEFPDDAQRRLDEIAKLSSPDSPIGKLARGT